MPILKNIADIAVKGAIGKRSKGSGLLGAGIGLAATRIATRSVPGALVVGGLYIAKKLYDRRRTQAGKLPEQELLNPATIAVDVRDVGGQAPDGSDRNSIHDIRSRSAQTDGDSRVAVKGGPAAELNPVIAEIAHK